MKKNIAAILLSLAVFAAAWGLILFPQEVSRAVKDGLSLCADVLLPTLFPFLVLSGFLIKSGLIAPVGRALDRLMRPVFHLPGACSSALLLGLIGGYPTGAKMAVTLYRNGLCSRREAEYTLSFCNNCGPGFLLGSVGYGLFGSFSCGMVLLGSHALAAVLTGALLTRSNEHSCDRPQHRPAEQTCTLPAAFVSSVTEAMQAFVNLSAFVLCFSAITSLVRLSGITKYFAALLPFSGANGTYVLLGLLEMTNGTLHLSSGSETERMVLAAALIAWGGLSVHCQVLSLMQDTGLSSALYFKGKVLHTLLAALLTAVLLEKPAVVILAVIAAVCMAITCRKKAVEKKRSVYYNREKVNQRGCGIHEPVPEKN